MENIKSTYYSMDLDPVSMEVKTVIKQSRTLKGITLRKKTFCHETFVLFKKLRIYWPIHLYKNTVQWRIVKIA